MLSSTQLLKVQALRKKIADAQPDTGKTLIMGVLNVKATFPDRLGSIV